MRIAEAISKRRSLPSWESGENPQFPAKRKSGSRENGDFVTQ